MLDPEGNWTRGETIFLSNWFPEGPDIKCFLIFLDFKFNVLQQQQKNTLKRNESKQLTRYL